jgi:hypothetical protein
MPCTFSFGAQWGDIKLPARREWPVAVDGEASEGKSLDDIAVRRCDVRFTPQSRHRLRTLGCPLSAKTGHTEATRGHANNE